MLVVREGRGGKKFCEALRFYVLVFFLKYFFIFYRFLIHHCFSYKMIRVHDIVKLNVFVNMKIEQINKIITNKTTENNN